MKEVLIQISTTTISVMLAQWLYSIIFCIFKSNKYEDTLADKIAKALSEKVKALDQGSVKKTEADDI